MGQRGQAMAQQQQAHRDRQAAKKASTFGGIGQLAGIAASFIPGIGPVLGPAIMAATSAAGGGQASGPTFNFNGGGLNTGGQVSTARPPIKTADNMRS